MRTFFFICLVLAALAAGPVKIGYETADWHVSLVEVVYNQRQDTTTFHYQVSTTNSDLSYWIIGGSCGSSFDLQAGQDDWSQITSDHRTGFSGIGFKRTFGQEQGTVADYTLVFVGAMSVETVELIVSGGRHYAIANISGPSCAAAQYSQIDATLYPDGVEECSAVSTPATGSVVTDVATEKCSASYTQYRRISLVSNGVTVVYDQIISVDDTTAPVFIEPKLQDITLSCEAGIPFGNASSVTLKDNCDSDPEVSYCEDVTPGVCSDAQFISRTWTATDECGNSECWTQTITIVDETKPVFSQYPADETYQCGDNVPAAPVITATDNCAGSVNVQSSVDRIEGACSGTYLLKRTWEATDNCANTESHTQYVHVVDTIAPEFVYDTSISSTRTADCRNIPNPMAVSVTDACSSAITPTFTEKETEKVCPYRYVIVRTWTAVDDCGNNATLHRYLIVNDREAPVISNKPKDVTVECSELGSIPEYEDITVSDNCEDTMTIDKSSKITPGQCVSEYVITKTYNVSDSCGNFATYSYDVTVIDTVPPTFLQSSIPANVTVSCENIPAAVSVFTEVDACGEGGDEIVMTKEETIPGSCPDSYTLVRSWVASDCAGNTATAYQYITVEDNTKPEIHNAPADAYLECTADDYTQYTIYADDNCDANVPLQYSASTPAVSCTGRFDFERTFTFTDDCGNSASYVQAVHVNDSINPVWTSFPSDRADECHQISAVVTPTASDSCSSATVTPNFSDLGTVTDLDPTCPHSYKLVREFEVCDECNNCVVRSQVVTVYDHSAPTLTGVPADVTVSCDEIPCPAVVTATDNCAGVELTYTETQTDYVCEGDYKLVRTWVATDACGLTTTGTQTITVFDAKAPALIVTPPANDDFVCVGTTRPAVTDMTQAWNDSCSTVTVTDSQTKINVIHENCEFIWNYTWVASDDCGNTDVHTTLYTVIDTTVPDCPRVPITENIECTNGMDLSPATYPTCTDECDLNLATPTYTDTIVNQTCAGSYVIVRQWSVADECGNVGGYTDIITVTDTTIPKFNQLCPADVTVDCDDVPAAATLTATDGCEGSLAVSFEEVRTERTSGPACDNEYTLKRTWSVSDDCGNQNTCQQIVTVEDKSAPVIKLDEQDQDAPCDNVPCAPQVCVTDNCEGIIMTYTETQRDTRCPNDYFLDRQWVATDNCGLASTAMYTIHVLDETAPVWNESSFPTLPSSIECLSKDDWRNYDWASLGMPTGSDNCATPAVDLLVTIDDKACVHDFDVHLDYSLNDFCNELVWKNFTIEVRDTQAPIFQWATGIKPAAEISAKCDIPAVPQVYAVVDACGITMPYTYTEDNHIDATCPHLGYVIRTWVAVDDCGLSTTVTQRVNMEAMSPPTWQHNATETADVHVGCHDTVAVPVVTAINDCGEQLSVQYTSNTVDGACAPEKIETRTWVAADNCGNAPITLVQQVFYDDEVAPVFDNAPADKTLNNQCAEEEVTKVTATDACGETITVADPVKKTTPTTCPYAFVVDYTWTAADPCGNTVSAEQKITYTWGAVPTWKWVDASNPTDLDDLKDQTFTYPCNAVPAAIEIEGVDGCGKLLTPQYVETRFNGSCINRYELERKWTIVDDCGMTNEFVMYFNITDNVPPALHVTEGHSIADVTVECPFEPAAAIVTATDNCPGVVVELTEVREGLTPDNCCNYTLTRTWTATDACGLVSSVVQIVTVHDTLYPVLINIPEDSILECALEPVEPSPPVIGKDAALAYGWCLDQDVNVDRCSPASVTSSLGSVYMQGKWFSISSENSPYIAWVNGRGFINAQFTDGTTTYSLDLDLFKIKAYSEVTAEENIVSGCKYDATTNPTGINPTSWTYYTEIIGQFINVANPAEKINLTLSTDSSRLNVMQIGKGATGRNNMMGIRADFDYFGSVAGQDGGMWLELSMNCNQSGWEYPELACGSALKVTVTETDLYVSPDCPVRWSKEFMWSVTDKAGHTTTAYQVQSSYDTGAPTWVATVPLKRSYECAPAAPGTPVASDSCTNVTTDATPTETPLNYTCVHNYAFLRTWVARDQCGNNITLEQEVVVYDKEAPKFNMESIADETVECAAGEYLDTLGQLTANDNCDGSIQISHEQVSNTPISVSGYPSCGFSYDIVRKYTAVDSCGLTNTISQTIHIKDTTGPTVKVPREMYTETIYECTKALIVPAAETITFTDNCEGDIEISAVETRDEDCSGAYNLTRVWTGVDECGNVGDVVVQKIIVRDTVAPVLTLPATSYVECDSVPLVSEDTALITAEDACQVTPSFEFVDEVRADGTCAQNYKLTRTWRAFDECGNSQTFSREIFVDDSTDPTWDTTFTPEITVECDDVPCAPTVTASDNCGPLTLDYTEVRTNSSVCESVYTLTRTWVAADDCGNTITTSQQVNVQDTTNPTWDETLPTAYYHTECNNIPPFYGDLQASDNCGNSPFNASFVENIKDVVCPNEYTITRTWTATDDCGLAITFEQTIDVVDTIAPIIRDPATGVKAVLSDYTKECNKADAPLVHPNLYAYDFCDDTPSLDFTDSSVEGCGATKTYNWFWKATDSCGRTSNMSQVIVIEDTLVPEFNPMVVDETQSCTAPINFKTPTWYDQCSTQDEIVSSSVTTTVNTSCPHDYDVVKVWTIVDECGLSNTLTQTIHVVDDTVPQLVFDGVTTLPYDPSYQCNAVLDAPQVGATDACAEELNVQSSVTRVNGTCVGEYKLYRYWQVEDCAGHGASHTQVVTVTNAQDPVWTEATPASQLTIACDETIPQFTLSCVDICDPEQTHIPATLVETDTQAVDVDSCNHYRYTINREWTCTTTCGRSISHKQTITVTHNDVPEFVVEPPTGSIEVPCYDIPEFEDFACKTDCGPVNASKVETKIPTACPNEYTLVRQWFCDDSCAGISREYTINVVDKEAPYFYEPSLPEDGAIFECTEPTWVPTVAVTQCGGDIQTAAPLDNVTSGSAADVCSTNVEKAIQVTNGFTLLATSGAYVVQNADLSSRALHVAADLVSKADATQVWHLEAVFSGYTAYSSALTPITLFPSTHYETCYAEDAPADFREWSYYATLERAFLRGSGSVEGAILELELLPNTYAQAGRGANNVNILNGLYMKFEMHVRALPNDAAVAASFGDLVYVGNMALELDECANQYPGSECDQSSHITVNRSVVSFPCKTESLITYTFTVKDCSDNTHSTTRTIHIVDTTAPEFVSVPADHQEYECTETYNPATVYATDNCECDQNGCLAAVHTTNVTVHNCPSNYTVHHSWVATDDCGNSVATAIDVHFYDRTAPVFDVDKSTWEANIYNLDCAAAPFSYATYTAHDSCSTITYDYDEKRVDGNCNHDYKLERTWTATDACGNSDYLHQVLHVSDTTPPTIYPHDVSCIESGTQPPFSSIDNATTAGVIFEIADDCSELSELKLEIIGCVSDQDSDFGLTVSNGFTSHCYMDGDRLMLKKALIYDKPEGRMYNVTGRVTDDCGLTATSVYQILVPLSTDSYTERGLPSSGECAFPAECPSECPPCTYDLPECEVLSTEVPSFTPATSQVGSSTVFSLDYSVAQYSPSMVTLGVDTNAVAVSSYSPSTGLYHFGYPQGSFVSGFSWNIDANETTLSLTFEGQYDTAEIPLQFMFEDDDDVWCWRSSVLAPSSRVDTPAATIKGKIGVNGLLHGLRGDIVVPLEGVAVELLDANLNVLLTTTSDLSGEFEFGVSDASATYYLLAVADGLLREDVLGVFRYLFTDTNTLVYQYGEPLLASTSAVNEIGILYDNNLWQDDDDRFRYFTAEQLLTSAWDKTRARASPDTRFNGNPRPASFWQYQLDTFAAQSYQALSIESTLLVKYNSMVADLLSGYCSSLSYSTPLELFHLTAGDIDSLPRKVAAIAFNHVSGHGLFEPYHGLQDILMKYLLAKSCDSTYADHALLQNIADMLLSAN